MYDYITITIYNHVFIYDITRNQKQVAEAVEDMRAQGASVLKQGAVSVKCWEDAGKTRENHEKMREN